MLVDALDREYHQGAASELLLSDELGQILEKLQDLEPIMLKGFVLANFYYPYPHLRPMDDIDLVVPGDNVDAIRGQLLDNGFTVQNSVFGDMVLPQFICTKSLDGQAVLALDIHTQLFNRPGMHNLLTYQELCANAITREFQGIKVLTPSTAHCLIHAALHLMAHHANSRKLIWLYDILLLGSELDAHGETDLLLEYARRMKISSVVLAAADACQEVFGLPQSELQQQLRDQSRAEASNQHPASILLQPANQAQTLLMDWKQIKGRKNRLSWLREHLFPPIQYMKYRYKVNSIPVIWFCYIWRIIRGSVRLVVRRI